MPSPKVFYTVTSSGQVRKVLRERYIRDVQCGSVLCDKCDGSRILSNRPCCVNNLLPGIHHYICLDTQLILSQSSIVLIPDLLLDVIVPITTLEEVRRKSFLIYTSLKTLLLDSERRYYLFLDEFYSESAIEENKWDMKIDGKFKSSMSVIKFYKQHLSDFNVEVVFLSEDEIYRDIARSTGVVSFTLKEYLAGLGKLDVCDVIASRNVQSGSLLPQNFTIEPYPQHLNLIDMKQQIEAGTIFQGVYYASSDNFLEGSVVLNDTSNMRFGRLYVYGRMNINRAIDGDIVACELLPKSEWSKLQDIVLKDDELNENDTSDRDKEDIQSIEINEENNDIDDLKRISSGEIFPCCKIVGIIRRRRVEYCGVIQGNSSIEYSHCLFVPVNRRIPKIRIETKQIERLKKLKIAVTIDRWPRKSKYPIGHYSKAIGEIGDRSTDSAVLLLEHEIAHYPFSIDVQKSLPSSDFKISDVDLSDKVDLRSDNICLFSIDPPGCTDIDDALHFTILPNGNFEIGVHIADVSYFVRPGTAVDNEARKRCTSVYLVDQRIDMLPTILSTNLCSLRERVDRLAFSVVWELNSDIEVVNTRFHRSIIRSRAALEYGQAQMIINDPSRCDDLAVALRHMNRIAKVLRKRRMDKGALSLESPEVRFVLDSEGGDPLEMLNKEICETNHLIEEFMLLANISVANKIYSAFPNCACLRRHPEPSSDSFEPLVKAALSRKISIDISSGKALADSLDKAIIKDHSYFNLMLRMLTTRCMTQAIYFCSGKIKQQDFRHYGLASEIYTHFTSPIRRYADIIVHRLLACAIHIDSMNDPLLFNADDMESMCNIMNQRHRHAQQASRDSVHINSLYFFKDKICDEEGYIFNIMRNAFKVFVHKYGIEVIVQITNSEGKKCLEYDKEADVLITPEKDFTLRMFDRVVVQISTKQDALTSRQKLNVNLVYPKINGLSVHAIR
ncbi:hypothetical protein GJ496_006504 [Pomphorhynchus laevis]|nr:hypothetical protein GJ496_006504 [Pomphorhynchus laevis]